MFDFKVNESYEEMREARNQLLLNEENKDNRNKDFGSQRIKNDDENIKQILSEILSNDLNTTKQAIIEFLDKIKYLSSKVTSLLDVRHIQKVVNLLSHHEFTYLSLTLLSELRQEDFTELLIDCGFLDFSSQFLLQADSEISLLITIIISNNSLISAKFRNKAFQKNIFHIIKDSPVIKPKTIAWCLKCALEKLPINLNIVEEISMMLIQLCEPSEISSSVRHKALQAFDHLESHNISGYRSIIVENKFISVLADITKTEANPEYRIMALNTISSCCFCGDECLSQIFGYGMIDIFHKIIDENSEDPYIISFINFLINSIISCEGNLYVSLLIEHFCNQSLQNLFRNHSTLVYMKAAHLFQKLFSVVPDPKYIINTLTEDIVVGMANLLFLTSEQDYEDGNVVLNVILTFKDILTKLLQMNPSEPMIKNVIGILGDFVENNNDYNRIIFDRDEQNSKVRDEALILQKMVIDLMHKDDF